MIHDGIVGFLAALFIKSAQITTVHQWFLTDGVVRFGLLDHGGENVGVWQYMITSHNHDYCTIVTGSSVHNERIQQLWRDVHRCVLSTFADTFRALESEEKVDPMNEVDLFRLHYVFLPGINRCLSEFQDSWNHHGLSSEANKSPLQLFLEGSMLISNYRIPGDSESMNADVSNLAGDCAKNSFSTM